MSVEPRSDWRSFIPVYKALQACGKEFIIVGGQACNIWSTYYFGRSHSLETYLPFTSVDLDVFVNQLETIRLVATEVGCQPSIAGPENADVVLGGFSLKGQETSPTVQFLRWSLGIETSDLRETAVSIELDEIRLKVIHPIYSLQGKICCLRNLAQAQRQDEKHAKMAVCYSACALHELVEVGRSRNALNGFEHVYRIALSPEGLHAWLHYGIPIENAVPAEAVRASSDEKIKSFEKERWPRLMTTLKRERDAYAARLPAKQLARFPSLKPEDG